VLSKALGFPGFAPKDLVQTDSSQKQTPRPEIIMIHS